jgi:4-amino-4-deoxy-L-arabinose transferase-like glycosyltransferase
MTSIPLERAAPRRLAIPLARPELAPLLLLAAGLNLWALARNGYANEYYSAAARAMSTSWHAFLFGAFDSAGLQTVDKPPLALWVQALAVRAFGMHPLSVLVPQALMGVASVWLTYDLVRRRFGRAGGFVAGLVLALTPVSIAIARHNNPDALLVLCCVAALWLTVRALEDGRTRRLVLAGVAVGQRFETKMAAALLVVPGIAAAYLWAAPQGRVRALRQLLAGGAALIVAGGAWPLLMVLVPSGSRPWISGTGDDSILSLILGYNGVGRLAGQAGGPQGGGGPGAGVFGGDPAVLRLLGGSLGDQAGWLLGLALAGGIALLAATRLRRADPRRLLRTEGAG